MVYLDNEDCWEQFDENNDKLLPFLKKENEKDEEVDLTAISLQENGKKKSLSVNQSASISKETKPKQMAKPSKASSAASSLKETKQEKASRLKIEQKESEESQKNIVHDLFGNSPEIVSTVRSTEQRSSNKIKHVIKPNHTNDSDEKEDLPTGNNNNNKKKSKKQIIVEHQVHDILFRDGEGYISEPEEGDYIDIEEKWIGKNHHDSVFDKKQLRNMIPKLQNKK